MDTHVPATGHDTCIMPNSGQRTVAQNAIPRKRNETKRNKATPDSRRGGSVGVRGYRTYSGWQSTRVFGVAGCGGGGGGGCVRRGTSYAM